MLYLVPSPLSQKTPKLPVLAADLPLVQQCKTWLVENAKPARAALGHFHMPVAIRDLNILEITQLDPLQRQEILGLCKAGEPVAVMSDAGCPGVADPGAEIVALAHRLGCPVHPLVGPSSILLALMGSGLNGQNFRFHGYPPLEPSQRDTWIKQTERESKAQKCTQMIIETPFRNEKLIEALLKQLSSETLLCVALGPDRRRAIYSHQACCSVEEATACAGKGAVFVPVAGQLTTQCRLCKVNPRRGSWSSH